MAVDTHAVAHAPEATHPVDVRPPLRRLIPLSLQHLLVAYAGQPEHEHWSHILARLWWAAV